MGFVLLTALFGIGALLLLLYHRFCYKSRDKERGDPAEGWGWFLYILTSFMIITIVIISHVNAFSLVNLKTTYQVNAENYKATVDKTATYLSTEAFKESLIDGSIEKFQLADSVALRITEWRDRINNYNKRLNAMRYWDSNVFFGCLIPTPPEGLKLLVIQ